MNTTISVMQAKPLPPASDPLVSVLMPAFNAAPFIAQAIQSILDQSYKHFELIILNDGSTDQTATAISQFSDPRITILTHANNQGLVSSRNALVAAANGKYIAFLDADDIASSDRLAEQVAFLEQGKVDICGSDHLTLFEASGRTKRSKQCHSDSDIRAMMVVACPLSNPTIMGKASTFKKYPYAAHSDVAEDYALWLKLALEGYRFANLKKNLLTYRVHSSQISQTQLERTKAIVSRLQKDYLSGLNIAHSLQPRPLSYAKRLRTGPQFLVALNRRIKGISFSANYQIYARFQFRGNRLWTPLTRLERVIIAGIATIIGKST